MVAGFVVVVRRSNEELRRKAVAAFRRSVTVLARPFNEDRSDERTAVAEALRSAAELRQSSTRERAESMRDVRTAVENERQLIEHAFQSVMEELASLNR